jgi:hypothetical protein
MTCVIKIEWLSGIVIESSSVPDGTYVQDYNPDACAGYGELVATSDIQKAMRFESAGDALEFYRQQSKVRPFRPDGRPNRPLMAYTVSIENIDPIHWRDHGKG